MFKNIEKKYKQRLKEYKFNKYYWLMTLVLVIISSFFKIPNNTKKYFIYISLFILVVGYFVYDFFKFTKKCKFKNNKRFSDKFNRYIQETEKENINNLLLLLKQYNFRTKNDLKLAIDYYNSEKPLKIDSDYLGWIVSVALTLSSFMEIAYNPNTQTIDMTKTTVILGSTFGIIIVFLIPIIIFKFIIKGIFIPQKRLQSNLSEDLSYIYLNFDKYKNQLNKN